MTKSEFLTQICIWSFNYVQNRSCRWWNHAQTQKGSGSILTGAPVWRPLYLRLVPVYNDVVLLWHLIWIIYSNLLLVKAAAVYIEELIEFHEALIAESGIENGEIIYSNHSRDCRLWAGVSGNVGDAAADNDNRETWSGSIGGGKTWEQRPILLRLRIIKSLAVM